jgi:hypothetical protein
VYLQFLVSPESYNAYRFYGGYLMHRVFEQRNVFLEAGLIPVHDGIWASQTYSNKNPLVGLPMTYYWKSTLASTMMPVDLDQMLVARGEGQTRVTYSDSNGVRGKSTPPCRSSTTTAGTTASTRRPASVAVARAPERRGGDLRARIRTTTRVARQSRFALRPARKWRARREMSRRGASLCRERSCFYQEVLVSLTGSSGSRSQVETPTPPRRSARMGWRRWHAGPRPVAGRRDVRLHDALRYESRTASASAHADLNVDR